MSSKLSENERTQVHQPVLEGFLFKRNPSPPDPSFLNNSYKQQTRGKGQIIPDFCAMLVLRAHV